MNIEKDRQSEARQKVNDLLRSAEEARQQKRIERGIMDLIMGNLDLLHNDELTSAIPGYLSDIKDEVSIDNALQLMQRLGEASMAPKEALRARAVMTLSLSTNRILATNYDEIIKELANVLLTWLARENEFIAGYEVLCRQLQKISKVLLQFGFWLDAERLLQTLYNIHTGKLRKKNTMRSVAKRTLDNIAQPEMLCKLFEDMFSVTSENAQLISQILLYIGRPAISYGLELIDEVENNDDREQLIRLLTSGGETTAQVFAEKLQNESRWDVRCEMLRILCNMENRSVLPLIEENMLYPDPRVQRESIECIIRIGGDESIPMMTEAIPHVDDSLKNVIVKKLSEMESVAIRDALLSLLDEKIANKDFADDLLLSSLVVGLRPYPDARSLIQIRELKEHLERQDGSKKVLHLIDDTLLMLESEMRHLRHRKPEVEEKVTYSDDPVAIHLSKKKTMAIEREVIELLGQGQGKQAAEKLFQYCVGAAREKDFATAERLRDRILGAHSGSLDLALEADKIILWERESKIPSGHFDLWRDLRRTIGFKEFDSLYAALVREQYRDDEIIAREGERNDRLYFINSGSVSLVCTTGSAKTFLKRFQPGSIIGADQFFSISVWTVTARARTDVELHSLKRDALRELELQYPGVEKKLQQYCETANTVPELLKMSGSDRRSSVRYRVAAIIRTLLVDSYGSGGHRFFVGQLQDISQGGFCYSIGIANKEDARVLLGRQVRFELELEDDTLFEFEGLVVGIEPVEYRNDKYRVHVRLIELLSSAQIRKIVDLLS